MTMTWCKVPVDFTPDKEVLCVLFYRSLPICTITTLKQNINYFNFRCKIQLNLPENGWNTYVCSPNCFKLQSPLTPASSPRSTGPRSRRPTTPTTCCCNSSNSNSSNSSNSSSMLRTAAARRGRPRRSRTSSPTRRWRSGPRNRYKCIWNGGCGRCDSNL